MSRRRRGFDSPRSRYVGVFGFGPVDPKTRGDCLPGGINSARPCKWTSCVYHFVNPNNVVHCLLDAYESERTLEEVAEILGLSKERVRQIETKANRTLKRKLRHLKILQDD